MFDFIVAFIIAAQFILIAVMGFGIVEIIRILEDISGQMTRHDALAQNIQTLSYKAAYRSQPEDIDW